MFEVFFSGFVGDATQVCELCTPAPQYPAGNFCEFCNTSIPVPETSVSSVRLPYPYPECTNRTEHNLGTFGPKPPDSARLLLLGISPWYIFDSSTLIQATMYSTTVVHCANISIASQKHDTR